MTFYSRCFQTRSLFLLVMTCDVYEGCDGVWKWGMGNECGVQDWSGQRWGWYDGCVVCLWGIECGARGREWGLNGSDVVKRNRLRWLVRYVLRRDDGDWVKKSMSLWGGKCERERKAKDDVESCSREGHERAWFEKGGCAGAWEVWSRCGKPPANPCVSGGNGRKTIVVLLLLLFMVGEWRQCQILGNCNDGYSFCTYCIERRHRWDYVKHLN